MRKVLKVQLAVMASRVPWVCRDLPDRKVHPERMVIRSVSV